MPRGHGVALLAAAAAVGRAASLPLCHMMYLNADNNLEGFIAQDFEELASNAAFVGMDGYRLQILIDRNLNYHSRVIGQTHEGEFGEPVVRDRPSGRAELYELYQGNLYLVTNTSEYFAGVAEANMDSADVLYHFLSWAVGRCQAVDPTEPKYFLQLGSHGYGWYGFGGDWANTTGASSSSSVLRNHGIRDAVSRALRERGVDKLDLLGFDACLMASMWTLKALSNVTKYFLASETTEPGHGWSYSTLSPEVSDIVSLGKDIISKFVQGLHGKTSHSPTPKILALFDTSRYPAFETALDAVFEKLSAAVARGHRDTFTAIDRSIGSALKWSTVVDADITTASGHRYTPTTAVDLISFLSLLGSLCAAGSDPSLSSALDDARASYDAMKVYSESQGAGDASGLHIWLPRLSDVTEGRLIRSWVCGPIGGLGAECFFVSVLYDYTTAAAERFFRAVYSPFSEDPDASPMCALAADQDSAECNEDSREIHCTYGGGSADGSQVTTTTTPGPGCQSYDLRQLVKSGEIVSCASDSGFQFDIAVSGEVTDVFGEVHVAVDLPEDNARANVISYLSHIVMARFDRENVGMVKGATEGYFYKVCVGAATDCAGGRLITAAQENSKNAWSTTVCYFPAGVKAEFGRIRDQRILTNRQEGTEGFLRFKSFGDSDITRVALFVKSTPCGGGGGGDASTSENFMFGSSISETDPASGGELVTFARESRPIVNGAIVYPLSGGPYEWSTNRTWHISSFRLGSDLAVASFHFATIVVNFETEKSRSTQCWASTAYLDVTHEQYCAEQDDTAFADGAWRSPWRPCPALAAVVLLLLRAR